MFWKYHLEVYVEDEFGQHWKRYCGLPSRWTFRGAMKDLAWAHEKHWDNPSLRIAIGK